MRTVILYTTLGCHLCEQAQALALPILDGAACQLSLVEIADEDSLLERYGIRIPVLYLADLNRELFWPFDTQDVKQFLDYSERE